ncbi:MAG: phage baseplate assembly protein V [bacterium]
MPTDVSLKVSGLDIDPADIISIQLDQSVEGHHVLRAVLKDDFDVSSGALKYGDQCVQAMGQTITMNYESDEDMEYQSAVVKQYKGLVTEVSFDNAVDGVALTILTARSPSIAMDQAKRNRVFKDEKASAIIENILSGYGFSKAVEATSEVIPYSVQYQETDYAFVRRLATSAGMWAFYDGEKFRVKKAQSSSSDERLIWPSTMSAFKVIMRMRGAKCEAQNYDYLQKKRFASESAGKLSASLSTAQQRVYDAGHTAFQQNSHVHGLKADSQGGLDKAVRPVMEGEVSKMFTALGGIRDKWVGVGECITAEGVGSAVGGKYFIKSVRFQYQSSLGPAFTVIEPSVYDVERSTGLNEESPEDTIIWTPPSGWTWEPWQEDLNRLTAETRSSGTFVAVPLETAYPEVELRTHRYSDIQPALVTDLDDPEQLGRVKVAFMWNDQSGQVEPDKWLRVMTPHSGNEFGFFSLPSVDDEVLVAFEHGDPDRPVILGCLYNGKDKSPVSHPAGFKPSDNDLKVWRTKADNEIFFSDASGKETIGIVQKDGKNSITLSMDGPTITIESDGDITIKGKTVAIESTTGDVTMKSAGALKAESTADLEIKAGMNLKAEGTMNADFKAGIAATVDSTNTTVKGAAMVTVQGALVKIN